jgi:flagellin-like hook-associated protein FlgL
LERLGLGGWGEGVDEYPGSRTNQLSTNLISGVNTNQIYRKNLETGELRVVSSNSSGILSNSQSSTPVSTVNINANGRFVAFTSNASNLVPGVSGNQIYVKDLENGLITLASSNSTGDSGNDSSFNGDLSADGKYLSFRSNASNLVPGVTGFQVYVKNLETGELILGSSSADGTAGDSSSVFGRISADGRYLALNSSASNLVPGVSGAQTYRKDLHTGEIILASKSRDGVQGDSGSYISGISSDGRLLALISYATNLVEGDFNALGDSFLMDLSVAGIQEIAGMVVSNQVSAKITLDLSKKYQSEISQYRAAIGTSISRASSFISNLRTSSANFQSAASQILDADIAEENSKLTSNSIIQQSASSVLAQANLQPQLVLGLLSGI